MGIQWMVRWWGAGSLYCGRKAPPCANGNKGLGDPLPLLPRTHHVLISLLVLHRRIPLLPRTHQVLIALLVLHRRIPLLPQTHQVLIALLALHRRIPLLPRTHQVLHRFVSSAPSDSPPSTNSPSSHRFVSSAPSDVNSTPNWTKLDHRIVKRTTMGAWWKWKWSWKGREKSCVQQKEQSISVQHTSYFFLQFEGPSIGKVAIGNRDL